ncbi:MAG: thrombospondin type 3 repeat-containing protein [Candidatus Omnitrophica bacterium]|nr:thrombospondin type 3 repeat-containing protein [Candidatus Omnitrophota bacterium]
MIEYQSIIKRSIFHKIIIWILIIIFTWEQVAYGADFAYFNPALQMTAGERLAKALFGKLKTSDDEVTNYDLLYYKQRASKVRELLPSEQESDQSSTFSPYYLRKQQYTHEEIIRQKQDTEDLAWQLRKRASVPEELPLKKKKSGGEGEPGKRPDYQLTNPDEFDDAHNYDDFNFDSPDANANISQTTKFDITQADITHWMQNAISKTDDRGVQYWIGFGDNEPEEERKIQVIMYFGDKDNRKIQTIFTGYRETEAGKIEAKYRIDYTYEGEAIRETRKYDISGGTDRLVEKSYYEGGKDTNHITKTITYGKDGSIIERREFKYTDNAMRESLLYESNTEENGKGRLVQKTVFVGAKDKELADYSLNYYTDENNQSQVSETVVYFYKDGKRAQDSSTNYRFSKSKQITYRGVVDTDKNGILSEEELSHARKSSMIVYDDYARLAGEETADYMVVFGKSGTAVRTTVYLYKGGHRAKDTAGQSNYRECMTSAVTYYGELDTNRDGKISDEELAAGIKVQEIFYDTRYRLKGEEVQDYSLTYLLDGQTIKDTTVFYYEGNIRAKDADNEDRMEKSVTYWGSALNADGTLKSDAKKKAETFYKFNSAARRGEEVADVSRNYYQDGETVRDTTVYFYNGNLRAQDATHRTGMERSATFWGDALDAVSLLDGTGAVDAEKVKEFIKQKMGIDFENYASAGEVLAALLNYCAGGDADVVNALKSLMELSPEAFLNQVELMESFMALAGDNAELLDLLLSIDLSTITTKDELIKEVLMRLGLDEISAGVIIILLSITATDGMTSYQYASAVLKKMGLMSLEEKLANLLAAVDLNDTEFTNDAAGAAKLKDFLVKLAGGEKTPLGQFILSLYSSAMTKEEFVAALKNAIKGTVLSDLAKLFGSIDLDDARYTEDAQGAIALLNDLLALAGGETTELGKRILSLFVPGMSKAQFLAVLRSALTGANLEAELAALLMGFDFNAAQYTDDEAGILALLTDLIALAGGEGTALGSLIKSLYYKGISKAEFIFALKFRTSTRSLAEQLAALLVGFDLNDSKYGDGVDGAIDLMNALVALAGGENTLLGSFIASLLEVGMTKKEFIAALKRAMSADLLAAQLGALLVGFDFNNARYTDEEAGAVLLRDDLIALAGGAETALGMFIKSLYRDGMTKKEFIAALKNALKGTSLESALAILLQGLDANDAKYTDDAAGALQLYTDLLAACGGEDTALGALLKNIYKAGMTKSAFLAALKAFISKAALLKQLSELLLGFDFSKYSEDAAGGLALRNDLIAFAGGEGTALGAWIKTLYKTGMTKQQFLSALRLSLNGGSLEEMLAALLLSINFGDAKYTDDEAGAQKLLADLIALAGGEGTLLGAWIKSLYTAGMTKSQFLAKLKAVLDGESLEKQLAALLVGFNFEDPKYDGEGGVLLLVNDLVALAGGDGTALGQFIRSLYKAGMTKEAFIEKLRSAVTKKSITAQLAELLIGFDFADYGTLAELLLALYELVGGEDTMLGRLIKSLVEEGMTKEEFMAKLKALFSGDTLEEKLAKLMMGFNFNDAKYDGEGGVDLLLEDLLALAGGETTELGKLIKSLYSAGMSKDEFIAKLKAAAAGISLKALLSVLLIGFNFNDAKYDGEGGALLLLQDLIAAAGGEDTALGKFIKSLYTAGMTKEQLVAKLKEALSQGTLSEQLAALLVGFDLNKVKYGDDNSVEGAALLFADLLALAGGEATELGSFIKSIYQIGMTKKEFIDALKAAIENGGLSAAERKLLQLLLSANLSGAAGAKALQLLLIQMSVGTKEAVEAFIMMLLGKDLSSFETPEELLNVLLLLIGGPALTELKDLLEARAGIADYTGTAVSLLKEFIEDSGQQRQLMELMVTHTAELFAATSAAAVKELLRGYASGNALLWAKIDSITLPASDSRNEYLRDIFDNFGGTGDTVVARYMTIVADPATGLGSAANGVAAKAAILLQIADTTSALYTCINGIDATDLTPTEFLEAAFEKTIGLQFVSKSLASFIKNIITLIGNNTLGDTAVRDALKALGTGGGPGQLLRLILSEVQGAQREALMTIVAGDKVDFIYLLMNFSNALETQMNGVLSQVDPSDDTAYPDADSLKTQLLLLTEASQYATLHAILDRISATEAGMTKVKFIGQFKVMVFLQELTDVQSDDDRLDGNAANDVPDLIEILIGTESRDGTSYPESLVYRYDVKDDAKLKSQTFFYIDYQAGTTPQSVADYSLSYSKDGLTIRDTSVYYYEDLDGGAEDVRASHDFTSQLSIRDACKTRVITYRNDARSHMLDYDKDGFPDYMESYTVDTDHDGLYDFEDTDSDNDGYSDGEEFTVGSDPLKSDSTPRTITSSLRYPVDTQDTDGDGFSDYYENLTLVGYGASVEVPEMTQLYRVSLQNGFQSLPDLIDHYLLSQAVTNANDGTPLVTNENLRALLREIAENPGPLVTIGDLIACLEANASTLGYTFDDIEKMQSASNDLHVIDNGSGNTWCDGIRNDAIRRTETFYAFGPNTSPGDEVADYTYNYSMDGSLIKDTTVFVYEKGTRTATYEGGLRAIDSVVSARKVKTISYLGKPFDVNGGWLVDRVRRSATIFYFDANTVAGDEIADYSYNYKLWGAGAGDIVKTTSLFIMAIRDRGRG